MPTVVITFGRSSRQVLQLRNAISHLDRASIREMRHWLSAPSVRLLFTDETTALRAYEATRMVYVGSDHIVDIEG